MASPPRPVLRTTKRFGIASIDSKRKDINYEINSHKLKAGDPVDLKLWTKSGEIQEWRNCIPLRYNFYKGTQQFKLLNSGQIRQARLACIFSVNNLEVFL